MCDDGGGTDEVIRVVMELVVLMSDVLLMEVEAKVVLGVCDGLGGGDGHDDGDEDGGG